MSAVETAEMVLQALAEGERALPKGGNDMRARDEVAQAIIGGLTANHGARYRVAGDAHIIRIHNISASCTGGRPAMLRAWATKAKAQAA
jgi:hypothetical protein